MKKLIIVLTICLPNWLMAQELFLIEDTITTSDIAVNALITGVSSSFDEALDNYKSYVKDQYDFKVKKENSTTYQIREVDVPQLSLKRGDLNTYLLHTDTMNVMAFSFQLGYDIFLTSKTHPEEMKELKIFVIKFLEYHYNTFYQDKIEALDKDLDKGKKTLRQGEDKINGMKKKVRSVGKKILKEDDEVKKIELTAQKQLIENEIDELLNSIPEQRRVIEEEELQVSKIREEYQHYLRSIGALSSNNIDLEQE